MTGPQAFVNGRYVPLAEASVSLVDAGFVWGATVVDNCRTYGGTLFRRTDHLERFRHDCEACCVPLRFADNVLTASATELITRNRVGKEELQLVTVATPGPPDGEPTLAMMTYSVPVARYRPWFAEGVRLVEADNPPVAENTVLSPRVKHRSRMAWWVAQNRIRSEGIANPVPLFFDRPGGTPTETAYANLLVVVGDTVMSPPSDLILDGISRRVVRDLCRSESIPFSEIRLDDLFPDRVSEVLLCGTGFGLCGVRSFRDRRGRIVTFEWPGPITQQLTAAWSRMIGCDLTAEFLTVP